MVHELVKLHGGAVRVESKLGHGSSFIVKVPLGSGHLPEEQRTLSQNGSTNGHATPAFLAEAMRWVSGPQRVPKTVLEEPVGSLSLAAFDGPRPHILIADDNLDMREYIARLLSPHFRVTEVADGLEALAVANRAQPDLVLSDVMMPRLDGFGLLREMRADAALRNVPFILLSARAGEEARVGGLDAGADDYLTKPFHARELLAKINGTLRLAKARAERTEILENINLAFMAMDPDFRIIYLNAEAGRLHGMTREKYLGRLHWEAFPESLGTLIETNYRRVMIERIPLHFENFFEPWQQWF
jgi:DNA-binding response OmpR family regulator